MTRIWMISLTVVTLMACGDSTTEAEEDADISGSWTYSAEDLSSPLGISCSFTDVQATIDQSGVSFTGSTQGGQWLCESPFGNMGDALGSQVISGGTVDGNDVEFTLNGLLLFLHMGAVSGSSMSGNVEATGDVDPIGNITLTGNWSASR